MEATIARTPAGPLGAATLEWLRATQRLARAVALAAGGTLVQFSRAGLLVSAGARPRRRL